jgi:hypothetical protein
MTARVAQWTIDVTDSERMAQFWSQALGYRIDRGADGSAKLYPPDDAPAGTATVWLQRTDTVKAPKNRVHPDLRPSDGDVEREVERLLALGERISDKVRTIPSSCSMIRRTTNPVSCTASRARCDRAGQSRCDVSLNNRSDDVPSAK